MGLLLALGSGFLLGVLTSAPIGPVAAMVVQYAVSHDRRAAYLCALGCALVDGAYALAASLGVSHILGRWPAIVPAMYLAGGLILAVLGFGALRRPASRATEQKPSPPPRRRAAVTGFVLAATNPVPLLAWIGLSGTVMAVLPRGGTVPFALGVTCGVLAWFALVAEATHRGKVVLGRHLGKVSFAVGVLLLGSSAICFWRAWVAWLG